MTDPKTSFEGAADTLPANGEGRLILCDCNGTLFDANGIKGFNRPLFDFLMGAKERGYEVHLHSGDAAGNMNTYVGLFRIRNKDFGAFIDEEDQKNEMGAILPKGEIPTFKAFLTIDDQHGGEFPSQATHQWSPSDPRMAATMAVWRAQSPSIAPSADELTAPVKAPAPKTPTA